jgi:hypothetical protein
MTGLALGPFLNFFLDKKYLFPKVPYKFLFPTNPKSKNPL